MGAGKSHVMHWMASKGYFPLQHVVRVDPDAFRKLLPEWEGYVPGACYQRFPALVVAFTFCLNQPFRSRTEEQARILANEFLNSFASPTSAFLWPDELYIGH